MINVKSGYGFTPFRVHINFSMTARGGAPARSWASRYTESLPRA